MKVKLVGLIFSLCSLGNDSSVYLMAFCDVSDLHLLQRKTLEELVC